MRPCLLALLFALTSCAAGTPRVPASSDAFSVSRLGPGEFRLGGGGMEAMRLRFLTPRSFHLSPETPDAQSRKVGELMVVKHDADFAPVRAEERAGTFTSEAGFGVKVAPLAGGNYTLAILENGRIIGGPFQVNPKGRHLETPLADTEHIYGFGDKRAAIDQHGNTVKLWNADAFASEDNKSYKNVPFFMSSNGYGVYLHNFHVMTFDIGATTKTKMLLDTEGGDFDFYVFQGAGPKQIVPQYTEITGRPAMVPRWFFGYHQGRAAPGFQSDEGLRVAKTMREKKLPIDVIYYDDWDREAINAAFVDRLFRGYNVRLTLGYGMPLVGEYVGVNHDETGLLKELAARKFLWVDRQGKEIIGPAEEVANDKLDAPNRVAYVDFFNPAAVDYMFEQKFSEPLRAGAALGMADFGELANVEKPREAFWPSNGLDTEDTHNIYGLAYSSALVDGSSKRTGGRSLGMVRPGTAGTQRLGWTTTGDSTPDYKNFRAHFKGILNLSLTGFSNTGFDIGGWNAHGPDDVYARWFAAGTFNPLMWSHGIGAHEPYSHGPAVESAAREFLLLRYRMIPFYYSLMQQANATGVPILRPFAMQVPQDPRSPKIDDEEFVGDDLVVAPVFNKTGEREVYLPRGTWYDFFGDTAPVQGGTISRANVPMNRIPAYVRAGALIPMGPPMQFSGEKPVDPLSVHFYSFAPTDLANGPRQNSFAVYEDDGESTNYLKGEFRITRFTAEQEIRKLRLKLDAPITAYRANASRSYSIHLHGTSAPRAVHWNGVEVKEGPWQSDGTPYWHRDAGGVEIHVPAAERAVIDVAFP